MAASLITGLLKRAGVFFASLNLINILTSMDKTVEKLKAYLKDKHQQKDKYEAALARATARQREIDAAPNFTRMEFCCQCHGDWISMAAKVQVGQIDYPYAYYAPVLAIKAMELTGKQRMMKPCSKGRRYITDKVEDPYYNRSKLITRQRRQAIAEGWFLQPGDPGFNTKYGNPFRQSDLQLAANERAKFNASKTRK